MRTVNRGANPNAMSGLRKELNNLEKNRSNDFVSTHKFLRVLFDGVCAYCERSEDAPTNDVDKIKFQCDHFKPRFWKGLIYDAENLVYTCHECNYVKGDQWPSDTEGYINPCETTDGCKPNDVFYFDFDDVLNLEGPQRQFIGVQIKVRDGLSIDVTDRAKRTIEDLSLNLPRGLRPPSAEVRRRRKGGSELTGPPGSGERKTNLAKKRYDHIYRLVGELYEARRTKDYQNKSSQITRKYVLPTSSFSAMCRQFLEGDNVLKWLPLYQSTSPRAR